MEKENKKTYTFAAKPSLMAEVKENVWRERTTLSEKIEELLKKYNKSRKKEAA